MNEKDELEQNYTTQELKTRDRKQRNVLDRKRGRDPQARTSPSVNKMLDRVLL